MVRSVSLVNQCCSNAHSNVTKTRTTTQVLWISSRLHRSTRWSYWNTFTYISTRQSFESFESFECSSWRDLSQRLLCLGMSIARVKMCWRLPVFWHWLFGSEVQHCSTCFNPNFLEVFRMQCITLRYFWVVNGVRFFCIVQHISLSLSLSIQHIPLSKHTLIHTLQQNRSCGLQHPK